MTFAKDYLPLLIAYALIAGIIYFWHCFMSRLVPPEGPADAAPWQPPQFKDEPPLHRLLTWMCGVLFVGLILEGALTFAYIMTVHGIMHGVRP